MTTTPLLWGAGTLGLGTSESRGAVGLSDGRILVYWTETMAGGAAPFKDIFGTILNADGGVSSATPVPFQLNTLFFAESEFNPAVAATNDGGFIIAFERRFQTGLPNELDDSAIQFERYDAQGTRLFGGRAALGTSQTDLVVAPSIVVGSDNGFMITFARGDGTASDLRFQTRGLAFSPAGV
jgi:hypothetical protein